MPSIVLIGPSMVGKTTVARLLSEQTGVPLCSTSQINFDDYTELGYDKNKSSDIYNEQGEQGYHNYMVTFYAQIVQRFLAQAGEAIFDLESEYVAFEDANLLVQLKESLEPFVNVILLLPSPQLEDSAQILRQRETSRFHANYEINDLFVEHLSNQVLAKKTFYTADKTPEQTFEEIIAHLDLSKQQPIILIGPMFTGKSTLGTLLAKRLNRSQASLDMLRWGYYKEIGYDEAVAGKIYKKDGFHGLYLYSQPYHAHSVERILADYPDSIIDFGAGHSVYVDPALLERVRAFLDPYNNVVLLLPSADSTESKRILKQRSFEAMKDYFDLHESFTRNGSFGQVAKQTIYTEDKTPEQVAKEILTQVSAHQVEGI